MGKSTVDSVLLSSPLTFDILLVTEERSHNGKLLQTIYCLQLTIGLSGPNTVNNPNRTNLYNPGVC